ncbi:hypothetical protein ACTNBM_11355 [Lachnospiraceae bacterium HCP1S3_C3]
MLQTKECRRFVAACLVCVMPFVSACGQDKMSGAISGGRDVMRLPNTTTAGELSSEDTDRENILAVVTDIDTDNQLITLRVIGKKSVQLEYSGATDIRNDMDEIISMSQIIMGNVVYIDYDDSSKKLKNLKVSPDEWKIDASGIDTGIEGAYIMYKNEKYTYDDNLIVISDNARCKPEDIELIDKVTMYGRDKKIDSIIVTRGHGYLQLENTGFYEGGIIEVGSEVITGIEPDMRLLVPEGTFKLTVTKGKDTGSKEITIDRNSEQTVNLAEFQDEGQRYGNIGFAITPDDAALYIDKKRISDYSEMVEVTYGEHEIIVAKDGYKVYKKKINIDSVYTPLEIELEPSEETTTAAASESSSGESESSSKSETSTKQTTKSSKETTTQTTTSSLADIVKDILQ